jgi:cobalt-precorrin 5A hydrolase/precorrin-3B C17-methyltransferase
LIKTETPVFVALTVKGAALARRLQKILPGSLVHGRKGRVSDCDQTFECVISHLEKLFTEGHSVIGICAAGILIRALGTHLGSKRSDPAVLAIAEDGSSAVPLLGGHRGANSMARNFAAELGGHAAITTAGDVSLGYSLDDPPKGWTIAEGADYKSFSAALLSGASVQLITEVGDCAWLLAGNLKLDDTAHLTIRVTDQKMPSSDKQLTLHPPVLVVGVGCERGCEADEVLKLVLKTLSDAGLSKQSIACVTSIDVKSDEKAVLALADHLGVPARFFEAAELEALTPRLINPSDVVFAEVGCHGVSEGAALAAGGLAAELIVPKVKSACATCAIARSPKDIVANAIGRARGKLTIVGIGPGTSDWRTPAVTKALAKTTDVVGYGLYLDILGGLIDGKERHQSELAQEENRVRCSLELASEGRDVALVCSGDAGIYALATLAFELLDREKDTSWNRIDILVEPGVSAIQAAAARIGAPIGHDFCLISLSDLLTPWIEIERRLKAAADGDFVVGLYNPVSKRRRHQLEMARDTLLTGRPPETPAIIARNLGRPTENVSVITLGELTPDHADMLTLVLIGNCQTKHFRAGEKSWVYTPRGYATKMKPAK